MSDLRWWPDNDDLPPRSEWNAGPAPEAHPGGRISWRDNEDSDLERLRLNNVLEFRGARVRCEQRQDLVYVPEPDGLGGVVLSLSFIGNDTHVVYGGAVLVGPGVALCARHVVEDYRAQYRTGAIRIAAIGTAAHGRICWQVTRMRHVPNTDLSILSLTFIDGLPSDLVFRYASITTRVPRKGERLSILAFAPDPVHREGQGPGEKIYAPLLASSGSVSDIHLLGRDRVMMPGACLYIDCASFGGMSGGPVFDSEGWLVGLVSSSLDTAEASAPTAVSLAISALACPFYGGWPDPGADARRSLLTMAAARMCTIERPESIIAEYPDEGRLTSYTYTTWRDR